MIYNFSHMFICLLWFCHGLPKENICQVFYCTHFTCNKVVLGVFNTLRNKVSRSSVEVIMSVQETS